LSKRKLQIRIVSGDGFFRDVEFASYDDLTDEQLAEVIELYELVAVGSMVDLLGPARVEGLKALGREILPEDLEGFQTVADGVVLPVGTPYGVFLSEEEVAAARAGLARPHLAATLDRMVQARPEPEPRRSEVSRPKGPMERAPRTGAKIALNLRGTPPAAERD
jgi:hypothetical protein